MSIVAYRPPGPVVAPEVAAQIQAAHTAGTTSLAALAERWHLTRGEVARVVSVHQPPAATP